MTARKKPSIFDTLEQDNRQLAAKKAREVQPIEKPENDLTPPEGDNLTPPDIETVSDLESDTALNSQFENVSNSKIDNALPSDTGTVSNSQVEAVSKLEGDKLTRSKSEKASRSNAGRPKSEKPEKEQKSFYLIPGQFRKLYHLAYQFNLETGEMINEHDIVRYLINECEIEDLLKHKSRLLRLKQNS